jgi:hypothetical protein
MSAQGIIPDPGYGGLIVTVLPPPAGVTNAYVPPTSFTVSSPLTFYGANCSSNRFDPQQLNAFEAEMLCLAATINPNGTWNTGSVCNLGIAFSTWAAALQTGGGVALVPAVDYPGSAASDAGAATPAYVAAAISGAFASPLAVTNLAAYPSTNDTHGLTAAYYNHAISQLLLPNTGYPGSAASAAYAATPSYVSAAISDATSTIEGLIPGQSGASSYPSSSDATYTTPAYVSAAIAAIGAGIVNYSALHDVQVTSPQNNQIPAYNSGASKWENIDAPYNIGLFVAGVMTNSEIVLMHVLPYAVEIASGASGSYAKAAVAATAAADITINKNGSSIGTIHFGVAGTIATFVFTTNQTFAAGDIISLVAPSSADATLANIGITLAGFRI